MGQLDPGFQRFSNATQKVNNKIVELSSIKLKKVINIAIIFIALAVIGCFDWVHFSFTFEVLKTSKYWVHLILRCGLLILLYNVGLNLYWDKVLQTDKQLLSYKAQYEEKNKLRDNNFEEFIERVLNPKLKKEAYIASIRKKLYKLDKHAKNYDKLLFSSILPERQEEKKTNKYCIKKQHLLDLLDEDYINKELDNMDVKYQRVDASVFNMDVTGEAIVSNYKVKTEIGKAKTEKTIQKVLPMVLCSIILSAIFLDPNFMDLFKDAAYIINAIVNMLMDILFCIWQIIRGVMDTKKIIDQEYTVSYANRSKILDEYITWNANNEESKAFKISCYIDKQYEQLKEKEENTQEVS